MNADDTIYGRIKNGVLTLSGNNPSVRTDGGALLVSDGPIPVSPDHVGEAPPVKDRMVTCRLQRASCPVNRIVVTRPDGFITFAALKWLSDLGIGLTQLDWDGTVIVATGPEGNDRPSLRRAQALAAGTTLGYGIIREILEAKLAGQAEVARLLGSDEPRRQIDQLERELDQAGDAERLLLTEANAASIYWAAWLSVPLRFARRYSVPEHWQTFGGRASPISGRPLRAATPGNAVLNYLYGVLAGEMTIALSGVGLDPGMGIFHTDRDRRPSLTYDAMEVLRPYVDAWLVAWLASAKFAKRDFYEEADGTVRLTRPLTSHLAMTAAIWRPATQAVAGWLAQALNPKGTEKRRLPSPLPALPAPRRAWQGLEPPLPKTCQECGNALAPRQRRFCSEACGASFHVATTTAQEAEPSDRSEGRHVGRPHGSGSAEKSRRHIALRRAWDFEHTPGEGLSRLSRPQGKGPSLGQLREWFSATLAQSVAARSLSEIKAATGLSTRYAIMIRQGYVPHPRHYPALATLVGVEPLKWE